MIRQNKTSATYTQALEVSLILILLTMSSLTITFVLKRLLGIEIQVAKCGVLINDSAFT